MSFTVEMFGEFEEDSDMLGILYLLGTCFGHKIWHDMSSRHTFGVPNSCQDVGKENVGSSWKCPTVLGGVFFLWLYDVIWSVRVLQARS